jgi:FkbM family methyltransferase
MTKSNLSGLFINCIEAQDSIFESGKMAYECLLNSKKYSLDYLEITPQNVSIPTHYDFYLFNYHHITMSWLDTKCIKSLLPGIKLTLVLEVSPNDPFAHCPPNDFDGYCVLDPTLKLKKENVFAFPRPLETFSENIEFQPKEVPVIGSFGFATPGKGFEHVIDAVNKEFEKAIVRINIPFASYTDESGKYARSLATMCRERAKDGIEVNVTHDFREKNDLIRWCGQNTLNCFLYDRNQPGLAATTDQAISSGRPLITSKNNTFRHIQSFIKPFPFQSLKEAIENTQPIVKEIQKEWSPAKFQEKFESVLSSFEFGNSPQTADKVELKVFPPWEKLSGMFQTVKDNVAIRTRLRNLRENRTLSRKTNQTKSKVTSYSQFGEDTIIRQLFDEIPIKYLTYLDIGANNPKFISNTYSFYESGFTGVLVEPNPYLVGKLRYVRPKDTVVNAGIGIDENVTEADFFMFAEEADGLSTFSLDEAKHWENVGLDGKKHKIERIWKMPLIGINQLIDEYFTECPDFISIDVEGWDLQILKTFDFDKYCTSVFCVETLAYNEDGSTYRIAEIYDFFESKGYFSIAETYANNIFVNKNLYDFYQYQKSLRKT